MSKAKPFVHPAELVVWPFDHNTFESKSFKEWCDLFDTTAKSFETRFASILACCSHSFKVHFGSVYTNFQDVFFALITVRQNFDLCRTNRCSFLVSTLASRLQGFVEYTLVLLGAQKRCEQSVIAHHLAVGKEAVRLGTRLLGEMEDKCVCQLLTSRTSAVAGQRPVIYLIRGYLGQEDHAWNLCEAARLSFTEQQQVNEAELAAMPIPRARFLGSRTLDQCRELNKRFSLAQAAALQAEEEIRRKRRRDEEVAYANAAKEKALSFVAQIDDRIKRARLL